MYAGSEAEGFNNFVFSAISAAVSMTTAWYTASGSAGHLLINKEAHPIPILAVSVTFLNTGSY